MLDPQKNWERWYAFTTTVLACAYILVISHIEGGCSVGYWRATWRGSWFSLSAFFPAFKHWAWLLIGRPSLTMFLGLSFRGSKYPQPQTKSVGVEGVILWVGFFGCFILGRWMQFLFFPWIPSLTWSKSFDAKSAVRSLVPPTWILVYLKIRHLVSKKQG